MKRATLTRAPRLGRMRGLVGALCVWAGLGACNRAPSEQAQDRRSPAEAPTDREALAKPSEVPGLAGPLAPPQASLLAVHAVDRSLSDPFERAPKPIPEGVHLGTTALPNGSTQRVAQISRVRGETLERTFARVRPWFDQVSLPDGRRFVFSLLTGVEHGRSIEAWVVEPEFVEIRAEQVEGVVLESDSSWIEVVLTPRGKIELERATTPLEGREIAFVLGDRVLWTPKLGGALGRGSTEAVGAVLDPAVAAVVRQAVRGDPSAIAAVLSNGVTDGGTLEDVLRHEQASRLPPPVREADGRTRLTLRDANTEAVWVFRAELPFEGLFRTTRDTALWVGNGATDLDTLRFELDCAGACSREALPRQIEARLDEMARPPEPHRVGDELYPRRHVILHDDRSDTRWVWARRLEHDGGAPSQGVPKDRVEAWCFAVFPGLEQFVSVKCVGPVRHAKALIRHAQRVCESLQFQPP